MSQEPESADCFDQLHDDFLGYHDPEFVLDDKIEGHVREKRSVFMEEEDEGMLKLLF